MPIYQYKATEEGCEYCKNGFEMQQSINDEALRQCPKCGSNIERVIGSFLIGKGNILSSSSLKEHGFTRLRKVDKGKYLKEGYGGE